MAHSTVKDPRRAPRRTLFHHKRLEGQCRRRREMSFHFQDHAEAYQLGGVPQFRPVQWRTVNRLPRRRSARGMVQAHEPLVALRHFLLTREPFKAEAMRPAR
jgi:hypothetical protein